MTREINGRIRMVVSDDGTRCAAECPHASLYDGRSVVGCGRFGTYGSRRAPACIAAEQAAASVPSCEGATVAQAPKEPRPSTLAERTESARQNALAYQHTARERYNAFGAERSTQAYEAGRENVDYWLALCAEAAAAASVPSCAERVNPASFASEQDADDYDVLWTLRGVHPAIDRALARLVLPAADAPDADDHRESDG